MGGTSRSNRTNKSEKKEVTKVKEIVKVQKPKHSEVERKPPTVVTPTRTKLEPKDKKKYQNNLLASFGLKPAKRKAFSNNKESKLKCCVVETPQVNSIVFRFQPNNPNSSNWSEKVLLDDIKAGSTWTKELNFDDICYTWFDRLEKQTNNKGYETRLFAINTETSPPTQEVLERIGLHVCKQTNETPGNTTVASVDKNNFIWIRDPTWADIIGVDQATRRLREALGLLEYNTLNNNIETVYSYFRDHQLPEHLRRLICAPNDQIVLDGYEETTHEDDKSDSDSDNCIDLKQPALV